MSEVAALRAFNRELISVVGSTISVVTTGGKTYTGTLKGIDQSTLSIVLSDVTSDEDGKIPKIFIYGSGIVSFSIAEEDVSLEGLVRELEKVFPPGGVKYYPDTKVIVVMNRVRISADGVDGQGPLFERVRGMAEPWLREKGLLDTDDDE